jgi:hypothetical protein
MEKSGREIQPAAMRWWKINQLRKCIKDQETIQKGSISMGTLTSLIFFFEVPKGFDDIQMVYDGTKGGLNAALWAPCFPLPTVDSFLHSVGPGNYMSDNDVGEMFLNFVLHASIQE